MSMVVRKYPTDYLEGFLAGELTMKWTVKAIFGGFGVAFHPRGFTVISISLDHGRSAMY